MNAWADDYREPDEIAAPWLADRHDDDHYRGWRLVLIWLAVLVAGLLLGAAALAGGAWAVRAAIEAVR